MGIKMLGTTDLK